MAVEITEKDFQRQVTDLAKLLGWEVYSARAAMTSKGFRTPVTSKGFPDLLLLRGDRLVAAELKVGTAVRPEQQRWLDGLAAAGLETHVWRPVDLPEIAVTLTAKEAK